MNWPSRLLHTRFDCYDKRDRILLKTLLKEAVVGRFKKAQLRNLNRWRLYPLLAPFVESLEETICVYACSLQEFAGRFFGIRNFAFDFFFLSLAFFFTLSLTFVSDFDEDFLPGFLL